MRFVVIGGGILGLATAWHLNRSVAGAEVVVLEKERALGRHQTSHNSGVVHAGLYYPAGSLKARLCRRGLGLLRDFCSEREIPYEACGKLVVATEPGPPPGPSVARAQVMPADSPSAIATSNLDWPVSAAADGSIAVDWLTLNFTSGGANPMASPSQYLDFFVGLLVVSAQRID